MNSLQQVGRSDLRHFDKDTTRLLLEAQDCGIRIRVTKRGHAVLYGSNGETATVAPNMKSCGRSGQNTVATVRRLLKGSAS